MSLMSKTRVESHTQKRSDERGALMLEAIALLGLMTLMSPMLVKQTSEKTQEVEEVTVAGQMKMLRDAAMSYIDANLGSLGDTSASGAFGDGYTGADGEKQSLVLDNRELAKFLPPGFCLEENGTCVFQNRLADNYRAAIVRQHSCDTRDADGKRTDECKPFDYTVLVVSGPRADNGTANEITDRRAMRIAAMIGADGGFIPSANMAAVTGDASKISVLGAQGIWEIPDVTDFFGANASWRPGRGQVAVTTVYKGNSNLGEFLYRKPTSVEGGNAMFTDLDMAGKVGMPNDEDGTVTDSENGVGDPHDIKGVKGIFMASNGGLYVKALPRNTTIPGTAEFSGGLPLAQFTRTSMMTGEYDLDGDYNLREHRIIHNLDPDSGTGVDVPGGTKIRHVDYNHVTNPTSPIGMLGGTHKVSGRATLDVFAPKVPDNPNTSLGTSHTNVGMSFNSQYEYEETYTAKSRMAITSAGYRRVDTDREMMDATSSAYVPQMPYIELESDVQDHYWDRGFNVSLNMNPTSKGVAFSTLSDAGRTGSSSISYATEYTPSFNLSAYKRDEYEGFTYKGGLFARPYSIYVDELMNVPYGVNMVAAGNGRAEPSLLLTRERNNEDNVGTITRMTQLNMGSGAGNFDTVSLTSRLARRENDDVYREDRAFVTLDEMPAQTVGSNGARLSWNTDASVARPVRYRIGAENLLTGWDPYNRETLLFSGLEGVNTRGTFYAQQARQDITTGGRLGAGEILKMQTDGVTRLSLSKDIKDYLNWGDTNSYKLQGGQTHLQFSGVEYKKYDRDFKSLISNNSASFNGTASTASLVAKDFDVTTDAKAFITTMTGPFTTFGEEVVDYERYMSSNGYYDLHKKIDPAAADIARMEQGLQGYSGDAHGAGSRQARIAMRTKDFYRDESNARKKYVGTSLNMEPIAYAANSMLAPSVRLGAEQGDFNDSYLQSSANLKMYAYDSNPKASLFTKRLWNYGAKKYVSGNSAGGSGVEQTYHRKAAGGLETEIASYNETAFENLYSKGRADGTATLFYNDTYYTAENNAEVRTRLSAFYEDNQDDESRFTDSSRARYYDEEGKLVPLSARDSYYPTSINDMRDMAFATGEAQLDLTNLLNVAALGASGEYLSSPTIYTSYQNPMSSYAPSAVLSAVSSDTSGVQTLAVDNNDQPFTNFTKASELKLRTYSLARAADRGIARNLYSLSYIPSANLSALAVMEQEDAYGRSLTQGSSLTMDAFDSNSDDAVLPQLRSSLVTQRTTSEQHRGFRNVDDWQKGKRTTSDFYSTDREYFVERGALDIKVGDTTDSRRGRGTGAYTGGYDEYRKADVRLTSEALSGSYYISRDLLRMTNMEDGAADGSESELELSSYVKHNDDREYSGVLGMSINDAFAQAGLTVGNQAPNLAMSQGNGSIFGFMTKTGKLGSQALPSDLYGPVAPNASLNFYYPWTNTNKAYDSTLTHPDVHATKEVNSPDESGAMRNEFLIAAPHSRISGGVQVTTAFRDTPIAEMSAIHLSLNNQTTLKNPNAVFGRLVLTRTQLTDHKTDNKDDLPKNIRPGTAIDLDTRYWTIRDGYIEIESDVYNYLGKYAADIHSRVYMFTSNGSVARTDGEEDYWGTTVDQLISVNSDGEYNYSTGRMDYDLGSDPKKKRYTTGSMFKYSGVPNKSTDYFTVYNKFRLDPAYVSVMNDIKLTSRGGANLSDILPNYVLKSIYTLTNQYAKGPWPCQTNNDSLILKDPKVWNKPYNFNNSNPGNCSFVVPRGRLAKLPAKPYTAGSSEQWYKTGYYSQNEYYDQNFETDCSLMNRFGYQNYCTMFVGNYSGVNPRSMFVSYASDNYYHCAGSESSGCLTHPFMGLVPAPGFKMSLNVYAPSKTPVTVDDQDAGLCPAGYLPVMTVTPTAFDVGKVIFVDAGSNVDAYTMPQKWDYTGGEIYTVNDLSKLPIVEEDDEITNVGAFTSPEYPKANDSLYDVFQTSRRFQNFGHQDYRTEVPFIYQPATRIAVAAKPLCATTPKNCLSQDFTDQLKNNGSSTADCGGSRRTLCGWAVAMGTVTPNKVKTSSNSPDYFWNMGGIFSGSMQALVHTYCYFNPKNFKFPNVRYDNEKGQLRPLDNQNLIMKPYDLN